jgi:hypothetical protein
MAEVVGRRRGAWSGGYARWSSGRRSPRHSRSNRSRRGERRRQVSEAGSRARKGGREGRRTALEHRGARWEGRGRARRRRWSSGACRGDSAGREKGAELPGSRRRRRGGLRRLGRGGGRAPGEARAAGAQGGVGGAPPRSELPHDARDDARLRARDEARERWGRAGSGGGSTRTSGVGSARRSCSPSSRTAWTRRRPGRRPQNAGVTFTNQAAAGKEVIAQSMEPTLNIPPTLIVNQGERLGIFVARALDFRSACGTTRAPAAKPCA